MVSQEELPRVSKTLLSLIIVQITVRSVDIDI